MLRLYDGFQIKMRVNNLDDIIILEKGSQLTLNCSPVGEVNSNVKLLWHDSSVTTAVIGLTLT